MNEENGEVMNERILEVLYVTSVLARWRIAMRPNSQWLAIRSTIVDELQEAK
jgi:hypothetical protein